MIITIDNIKQIQDYTGESVVHKVRLINQRRKGRQIYMLTQALDIQLRNYEQIHIPQGFTWDLSSVPRLFWALFPPDGEFELASLIHDYLYQTKIMSRERADVEMFAWSKAVAGTTGRNTWSDVDNWIRYAIVRIFGWAVYFKKK